MPSSRRSLPTIGSSFATSESLKSRNEPLAKREIRGLANAWMSRRNGWLRSNPAKKWKSEYASLKRPLPPLAPPQIPPRRQNRHIRFNFSAPTTDLLEIRGDNDQDQTLFSRPGRAN